MPYSSPVDIRNALAPGVWPIPDGEATRRTYTAADLSDGQLADAISEADDTINAALAKRYVTPAANVNGVPPAPLRTWSRNIAAYNATLTYRRGADLTDADPVVRRYRMTMDELIAVRDGKSTLSLPGNTGTGGTANAGAPFNPYSGHLFDASDFNLRPDRGPGPFTPGIWRDYR